MPNFTVHIQHVTSQVMNGISKMLNIFHHSLTWWNHVHHQHISEFKFSLSFPQRSTSYAWKLILSFLLHITVIVCMLFFCFWRRVFGNYCPLDLAYWMHLAIYAEDDPHLLVLVASGSAEEWQLQSVISWSWCSCSLFCTTKKIHLKEQKQNCLSIFRCLEPPSSDLETKMFFFFFF